MAEFKGLVSQSEVSRGSEGSYKFVRSLRDGSLVSANWKLAGVMQGIGYHAQAGAFSTPIVGGGNGTVIDQDQPDFFLSVPTNTSIIPIRIQVVCDTPISAADDNECDIVIAVDKDVSSYAGVTIGTTATAVTINNMNTNVANTSACTAASQTSGNFTASPTLDLELFHKMMSVDYVGTPANAIYGIFDGLYEPEAPVILNGSCTLFVYWGGTVATNAFCTVEWLEFPTAWLSV